MLNATSDLPYIEQADIEPSDEAPPVDHLDAARRLLSHFGFRNWRVSRPEHQDDFTLEISEARNGKWQAVISHRETRDAHVTVREYAMLNSVAAEIDNLEWFERVLRTAMGIMQGVR